MENMVELRSVTKRFGDFVAVENVDLHIRGGEFLTLLGPSGCGKTTLLRMISGFETPSEGAVLLASQDVTHLPPYRRDVNQVFQSYALFPHLNVWDNIAFGLKMQRIGKDEMRDRVQSAIDLVSLGGMERRKPQQLSGGQRQRVALARALVCRPKVLLLDEPLSALDAKLRRSMQIELKRLQAQLGITFVFVTHDQEEALVMSDRIAVVNRGRIEQIGGVSDIYHQPRTRFVADFIGQANVLEARVLEQSGTRLRVDIRGFQLELETDGSSRAEQVLICIRPEKMSLSHKAPPGANCFAVTVREEIFRGATDQLLLQTDSGLELTALVANESTAQESFHRGDRLYCTVHPADVVVLT